MVQIREWSTVPQHDQELDNSFLYNDMIIERNSGSDATRIPLLPIDDVTRSALAEAARPEHLVNTNDAATQRLLDGFVQPGDEVYRRTDGVLILRRPRFTQTCSGTADPYNVLQISPRLVNALAAATGVNFDNSPWCLPHTRGTATAGNSEATAVQARTPFNINSPADLVQLRTAIARLRNARTDADPIVRRLGSEITTQELDALETSLETRRTAGMNFMDRAGDWIHHNPVASITYGIVAFLVGTAAAAVVFTIVGHKTQQAIQRREATREQQDRRPPDDQDPPTAGGTPAGGGSPVTAPATAPSAPARRLSYLERLGNTDPVTGMEVGDIGELYEAGETSQQARDALNVVVLGAGVLVLGVISVVATFDPVPGDEVAAGSATAATATEFAAALSRLAPALAF